MSPLSDDRRVVVTGLGLVTPLGADRESSWAGLLAGRSGVAEGAARAPFGELPEPRALHFVRLAAAEALADAGVEAPVGPDVGVSVSASKPLLDAPLVMAPESVPHVVAWETGAGGPVVNFMAACATGVQSAAAAAGWIREGRCRAALAGASESSLLPLYEAGFRRMGVLSASGRVRPFDRSRDGFVMGEGAGVLHLESLASARARGARVYGELTGWDSRCDPNHAVRSLESGRPMAAVLARALEKASLKPGDIDYVNAHGTATALNDAQEAKAFEFLFAGGRRPLISSTKGATGHLLGAAGAVELVFAVLALRDGKVPPTLYLDEPESLLLDFVPHRARPADVRRAASVSFGFGGSLAAAVVERI